jgi:hypothetical protein
MKMSIGLLGQSFFFDFTEGKKKIDDLDGGFEDLYCTFVGLFFCTYKKEKRNEFHTVTDLICSIFIFLRYILKVNMVAKKCKL